MTDQDQIVMWVKAGLDLAQAAAAGVQTAIKARDAVNAMVAESREPIPEEWALLNQAIDALVEDIQDA